jgi:mono/diheme cytochrome c family protein
MAFGSAARRVSIAVMMACVLIHGASARALAPSSSDDVKRGAYLVRVGDCVSCHTAPGGKPFAGGVYMPTPFGQISVPNITPDRATGIGNWTDEDFYRAMHEGIGRTGEYLYPVFPFPWFTKVTKVDSGYIKAYLMSLQPVNSTRLPLKLSFPANVRESLLAWRALFFAPGEFKADPRRSAAANRGAYLVQGLGHCGECHNQRNEAGTSRWSGRLEGGEIEGWYAPNLTSDSTEGIGAWSINQLASFLKTGSAPNSGVVLGPMKDVIDDSTSHLDAADLRAIALFLKSVPPKEAFKGTVASEFASARPPGAQQYLTSCAFCHGVDGKGVAHEIPSLVRNGAVIAQGPQDVIRVLLSGLPAAHGLAPMPAVGATMSDEQVVDTVNYVRNAFGNAAPGTAATGLVAELRAATKSTLAGDLDQCHAAENAISRASEASHVATTLHAMTESNILQVINQILPSIKARAPRSSDDDIVNGLTNVYCSALAADNISQAERSARLGNFATLTYGQLKSNGRE